MNRATHPATGETFVLFWGTPDTFSNWHPAAFSLDGFDYLCAEQRMMHKKALLFGDGPTAAAIMAAKDPREHKRLGRLVSGFDQAAWESARMDTMVEALLAKFSQNPAMLAALRATGDDALVEASPYDRIWGIGLGPSDPRASDRSQWLGTNLLGQALMSVRAQLGPKPSQGGRP